MNTLHLACAVMLWTWRKTLRRPVLLTFSLLQPWIWLVLFGFLFQRYAIEGARYLDYLVPGVACMTVLLGASQSGVPWIRDMQTGFLARLWRTPASRGVVLGAKVLADALRLSLQAAIICACGALIGARFDVNVSLLPLALLALLMFGASLCCVSCAIALWSRNPETMGAYVHVVSFPILFTSSALVPRHDLPAWLARAASINPMTAAVDALRAALQGGVFDALTCLSIGGAWLMTCGLLAALALQLHVRRLAR